MNGRKAHEHVLDTQHYLLTLGAAHGEPFNLMVGDRVTWDGVNGVGEVVKVYYLGPNARARRAAGKYPSHATVVWRPAKGGKITAAWIPVSELHVTHGTGGMGE